jgi:hypothetical protein
MSSHDLGSHGQDFFSVEYWVKGMTVVAGKSAKEKDMKSTFFMRFGMGG